MNRILHQPFVNFVTVFYNLQSLILVISDKLLSIAGPGYHVVLVVIEVLIPIFFLLITVMKGEQLVS